MPYGLDDLLGHHAGGQYAATVAAQQGVTVDASGHVMADASTPTASTAASPGGQGSKAAQVAQDPTLWLIITLGAGLALYWYSSGTLKVSV